MKHAGTRNRWFLFYLALSIFFGSTFSIRVGFDNKNGQKRSEFFLVHFTGFSVVWDQNIVGLIIQKINKF